MAEVRLCRQCAAELTGDAPAGLCPPCLRLGPLHGGTGDEQLVNTGLYVGPAAAPVPATLGEHFPFLEILELLGQGGMGTVYKARQLKLDRLVALKILSPGPTVDRTFTDRFLREARALARLSHPHIVTIHDFGEAGPLCYFVMEFVEGGSLRQFVRPARLPQADALSLLLQICDALQYAHEEGIVHRDIKPENLLLDKRGRIKIADFGLARLLGPTPAAFTLTGSQQAMGTPHYMAPEQWEKAHTVDHRADIYSLGVVVYEMLTGELPLGRFDLPSQRAPVDARLDALVLRALQKAPERRYQQVAELRADAEAIAGGKHGPAPVALAQPGTLPFGAVPAAPGTATQVAVPGAAATEVDELALKMARRQINGPAAGLTWAAGLSLIQPLLLPFLLRDLGPSASGLTRAVLVALTVVAMAFGTVTILAARRMRQLEAPEFALIGGILAMVPLGPGWALGLPMGIWALLVLRKPDVQAAFAAAKPKPAAPSPWRRRLPGTTAWAALCCLLGIALGAAPWASFRVGNREGSKATSLAYGALTWHGSAATLLFLALAVALLAARRTWPGAVQRSAVLTLTFLRLLMPLAGLALLLFLGITLAVVGWPGRIPEGIQIQVAACLALALLLIATVFLRGAVWRPVALLLAGLAVFVLVGLFIVNVQEYKIDGFFIFSPRPAGTSVWDWQTGPATPTPVPFFVLACAAGLVVLGCFRLPGARRGGKELPALAA